MHVGEISFCDKVAYNIKSEDAKKYILDRLDQRYGVKIIHKHFEKFVEERSVNILRNNPHLVCVRSNGNPYFLYLMKYNFIQYAVFIDKKIQQGYYLPRMIVVHMSFDDVMFEDTIVEGEMVKANNGKWYYLINDMLVCMGRHLQEVNHPKRMNMLYDVLEKYHSHEEHDLFRIGVKTFFRYTELKDVMQSHIQQLPYTCRGFYFKPLYMKFKDILLNFDDNLIKKVERVKYKDITKQAFILSTEVNAPSVDSSHSSGASTPLIQEQVGGEGVRALNIRKTSVPDVYELYDPVSAAMVGVACVPTLKISKRMRDLTKDLNMVDKVSAPFALNEKFGKYMLHEEALQ